MVKNERSLEFFVPGQLLFLVEHQDEIDGERAIAFLREHPVIASNERLRTVRFNPERVLSFQHRPTVNPDQQDYTLSARSFAPPGDAPGPTPPPQPPAAPAGEPNYFSLVFGDVDLENENLIALLDELDYQIMRDPEPGQQARFRVRTVSPNWLASSTPRHVGTGGPGAEPVPFTLPQAKGRQPWANGPVNAPGTPFGFNLPSLQALQSGAGDQVQVAILDTAPPIAEIEAAYRLWSADHPVLRSLLDPSGTIPSRRLDITYAPASVMDPLNDENTGFEILGHEYKMTDHGLFIAGIVHTIAPRAALHLVQVLNDFGVGSLETIAQGLRFVAQRMDARPLIVNLSLMLDIPLPGMDKPRHNRQLLRLLNDVDFLDRMGWALEWICDALQARDALVVAAAGNDGKGPSKRPGARYPAAFSSVVGVGALNKKSRQPADYSNLSDRPSVIGIATFGGEISQKDKRKADDENGILGLYIGEFPGGEKNENGWARWAGTSFAAPVIAGALALLRSQVYTAEDALNRLYSAEPGTTSPPATEEVLSGDQG